MQSILLTEISASTQLADAVNFVRFPGFVLSVHGRIIYHISASTQLMETQYYFPFRNIILAIVL